jgi:hypothetical protein
MAGPEQSNADQARHLERAGRPDVGGPAGARRRRLGAGDGGIAHLRRAAPR